MSIFIYRKNIIKIDTKKNENFSVFDVKKVIQKTNAFICYELEIHIIC